MPVQKRIVQGETAEIRCQLVKEGNLKIPDSLSDIFSLTALEFLKWMTNGILPNDLYPLDKTTFRLYYTSLSEDQQVIDVYIEDSFGQVVQRTFSFQNERNRG